MGPNQSYLFICGLKNEYLHKVNLVYGDLHQKLTNMLPLPNVPVQLAVSMQTNICHSNIFLRFLK